MEGARVALVTAGGLAGTAREAVDRLRDEGVAAGLLKVRLFRPFPAALLADALAPVPAVAVIDRNCSVGSGGIFAQEIRAALQPHPRPGRRVFSYVAGLGGVNVSVERLRQIARDALGRPAPWPEPILEEALVEDGR
jgi:pyruvate/2-oxoacid:ferredoxin oxidoreductase alpha subunit